MVAQCAVARNIRAGVLRVEANEVAGRWAWPRNREMSKWSFYVPAGPDPGENFVSLGAVNCFAELTNGLMAAMVVRRSAAC